MKHIDDPQTQRANQAYIRHAMDAPMLEKAHELDLARRWRENGDQKALHELVSSYTRLVISMAGRFRHYGLPMGDLIQEGNIGLMQAAAKFEPERDLRFSTYAAWWIRSSIQDYVLRNWSIVRTGTTSAQKALFFNLKRLRAKIEGDTPKPSSDPETQAEIARMLDVPLQDVRDMESRLSGGDHSLNVTIGQDGGNEWQDLLQDNGPSPEDIVQYTKDSQSRSAWLNEVLNGLNAREQTIIRDRHLTYEPVTLEDLGKDLGISKERVRQIEQRAMEKLKTSMLRYVGGQAQNLFLEG